MKPVVIAVSRSETHSFSKQNQPSIRLLAGLGVEGDAHMGRTVKHRARAERDPSQPNLRQVHLMHAELFDELRELARLVQKFRVDIPGGLIAGRTGERLPGPFQLELDFRPRRQLGGCSLHRHWQHLHNSRAFADGPIQALW